MAQHSRRSIRRNPIMPALFLSALTDIHGFCAVCLERHRQRRALARLDQRLLHDIGLTAEAADAEAKRSFWR